MLFNSYIFLFIFLPITFILYFGINKISFKFWKIFLVLASLFFYSWWNIVYLPIILVSIIFNYILSILIWKFSNKSFILLLIWIFFNLLLLWYFKYYDFFIWIVNNSVWTNFNLINILLPLAISFFTFQQIAFLVDTYKQKIGRIYILDYMLFITFFPQLIAWPIVHHKEMMPQFFEKSNKVINLRNISLGIFIFFIWLFKKVVIADTFSVWANNWFDYSVYLTFFEAWATSLSYTFQLYFDFSWYVDMAIWVALIFNIILPINFNSPYKSLNIQDFWKRWHMTLSRFLRDYIYIPLWWSREWNFRLYMNIMVTFIIWWLWHWAAWTFILWWFLHWLALIIYRLWSKLWIFNNKLFSWFITFNFINITWIFFRANSMSDAFKVLNGMFFWDIVLPTMLFDKIWFLTDYNITFWNLYFNIWWDNIKTTLWVFIFIFIVSFARNSIDMKNRFRPNFFHLLILFFVSSSILFINNTSEFLYFNF